MWIQFLGTGDAFCSGGRFQTCFLVKVPDYCFLIDCGATSLLAMKSRNIDTNLIDGIIISHFHGDHFGGLPYFLLDANFSGKRTRPLNIAGPPGVAARVGELLAVSYPMVDIDHLTFAVEFIEFRENQNIAMGPLQLETFPVVHVPASLPHGIRVNYHNTTLAFSGDTGWTDNLYKIANAADLFICECNFFSTVSPAHLNYQKINAERDNLNCKRIIINHLGAEMLDNMDACKLECSHDGMIVEI
ncbi:MAG: MBL fold metallo-hydrolase [Bacteroidetes bacterium]|nr:MAG: MBL fold metallo-hydrolase [Bacteroidota bacterium]